MYGDKTPAPKDAGEQKIRTAKVRSTYPAHAFIEYGLKDGDFNSFHFLQASELESRLDASLRVLYLKQLTLLRDKALARYKAASKDNESSDYEAMVAADAFFG